MLGGDVSHTCGAALFAATFLFGCSGDYTPVGPTTTPSGDADEDGYSIAEGDCDDGDAAFYPGANDVVGDAKDQSCDGIDGVDEDDDDHASQGSGGDDCDDADRNVYTGAPEVGWDGIDQDCDQEDRYDFDEVAAGKFHTCALDSTGTVRCWGGDDAGQVSLNQAFSPGWTHVCSGWEYSCASHTDGQVECWGSDDDHVIQDKPDLTDVDQITCGQKFACALDRAGYATCWGTVDDPFGAVADTPTGLQFSSIAAGGEFACAVTEGDGMLVCWGDDRADQISTMPMAPLNVDYISVTAGLDYACGIRKDLGIKCWGHDADPWPAEPPNEAGPYSFMSASHLTTCGIFEAKDLSCWGNQAPPEQLVSDAPDNVDVHYVSIGHDHGCAITNGVDGLVCWGSDLQGQSTPVW